MNNNISLKIVVTEASVTVRSGPAAVLKCIPNLNTYPVEVSSSEALQNYAYLHTSDIVIVNPTFDDWFDLPSFKTDCSKNNTKHTTLVYSVIDNNALKEYDESIAICDDLEAIIGKINYLLHTKEEEEKNNEQETFSRCEKEATICAVKGMTNKMVTDKLYLSIHTAITHRHDIARKLQIHSPAGLTIYATVDKPVGLQDIKDPLQRELHNELVVNNIHIPNQDHTLVRRIPYCDTACTTVGYFSYHSKVHVVPSDGISSTSFQHIPKSSNLSSAEPTQEE